MADILSRDAVRIAPGAGAEVLGWGGDALPAHVIRIDPSAETKVSALGIEEQRVNVVLGLDGPHQAWERLGHGFRVVVRIDLWQGDDILAVPIAALFRHGDSWAVFAAEEGRARLRLITIGARNDSFAEVREGLAPGEAVILHPSDRLRTAWRLPLPDLRPRAVCADPAASLHMLQRKADDRTMTELTLAADFPALDRAAWMKRAEAALKGDSFESRLINTTADGIRLEALYGQQAGPRAGRPFTQAWTISQRSDHPDPHKANVQALDDLGNGATGLTLVARGSATARVSAWTWMPCPASCMAFTCMPSPCGLRAAAPWRWPSLSRASRRIPNGWISASA